MADLVDFGSFWVILQMYDVINGPNFWGVQRVQRVKKNLVLKPSPTDKELVYVIWSHLLK